MKQQAYEITSLDSFIELLEMAGRTTGASNFGQREEELGLSQTGQFTSLLAHLLKTELEAMGKRLSTLKSSRSSLASQLSDMEKRWLLSHLKVILAETSAIIGGLTAVKGTSNWKEMMNSSLRD